MDLLLGLLEKIYVTMHRHSPVLQQFFEVGDVQFPSAFTCFFLGTTWFPYVSVSFSLAGLRNVEANRERNRRKKITVPFHALFSLYFVVLKSICKSN